METKISCIVTLLFCVPLLILFGQGATDNIFTYFRFLFIITLVIFIVIVMVIFKDE